MLDILQDYGWELKHDPFEYSTEYNTMWVHLEHQAFPDVHVCIEIKFDGLNTQTQLSVSDDNIDGAGDSSDVYHQTEFDPNKIWEACEQVLKGREEKIDAQI